MNPVKCKRKERVERERLKRRKTDETRYIDYDCWMIRPRQRIMQCSRAQCLKHIIKLWSKRICKDFDNNFIWIICYHPNVVINGISRRILMNSIPFYDYLYLRMLWAYFDCASWGIHNYSFYLCIFSRREWE